MRRFPLPGASHGLYKVYVMHYLERKIWKAPRNASPRLKCLLDINILNELESF